MDNLKKWIKIRKDLYKQLECEVRQRLGRDTPGLMRYQKAYENLFLKTWNPSSKEELMNSLVGARVLLLGDFHALHQSQKSHIRVLRKIVLVKEVVLALEFVAASDQEYLDLFMRGDIAEETFLTAIRWNEDWGFPWSHYRAIFDWARKERVKLVGINKVYQNRSAKTLKLRDVFSAEKISHLVNQYPEQLIVVIYGDLHLATKHLPSEIVRVSQELKLKDIVRVYQNAERIYFKLMEQRRDIEVDIVRISAQEFCLMSVPPWVKWQNYLMYLEKTYDQNLDFQWQSEGSEDFEGDFDDDADDDDDFDDDMGVDYTDSVARFVKLISEELGFEVKFSELSVYHGADNSFWEQVELKYSVRMKHWIQSLISDERSFYLPELKAGYLARATVNHAAQLAMSFIISQICQDRSLNAKMPTDFEKLIWRECLIYFGSKIINPRQKTDTIVDIRSSLQAQTSREVAREALQLALAQKMNEILSAEGAEDELEIGGTKRRIRHPQVKEQVSYIVASRLLGRMMGERLYFSYASGKLKRTVIRQFIELEMVTKKYNEFYLKIVQLIDSLPAPFESKKDRL